MGAGRFEDTSLSIDVFVADSAAGMLNTRHS